MRIAWYGMMFLMAAGSALAAAEGETPAPAVKSEAKKSKKTKRDAGAKGASAKLVNVKRPDGLVIKDVKVGAGPEAKLGSKITVHYRGTLLKGGKEFDSSYGGDPITFPLEEGQLIKGWTEGIPGMRVGGKRKLVIPYDLAYGERAMGDKIPAKSDLNFEVELIKVE